MSLRFTNTDKWSDTWFSNLSQLQMLLFIYLCENCDIAGFIEINYKRWASDLNSSIETIKVACKELQRGLLFSKDEQCIFIKNFLKHQKNYPLNEKNNCHKKIVCCFTKYSELFDIKDIDEFIQGASKGLISPIGNGRGNGRGKKDINKECDWYKDFETYKQNCRDGFDLIKKDKDWLQLQESYYFEIDVIKSVEKNFVNYWSTENGWEKKKQSGSIDLNWKSTMGNSLKYKENRVYKQKQN